MQKRQRSILVTISHEDDKLRLSLDDAVQVDGGNVWRRDDHFTSKLIETQKFDDLNFDEKELADFGYHIMARLYAFKKMQEI